MLPTDIVWFCKNEVLKVFSLILIFPKLSIEWTVTPTPITLSIGPTSSPTLNLVVFADPTLKIVVKPLIFLPVVVKPATKVVWCTFNPVAPIPIWTLTSSPGINPLTVDPIPTFDTLRTLVSRSQDLTLASVLDAWPTTRSLYKKLPYPVIISGFAIVTAGATVYPAPGFINLKEDSWPLPISIIEVTIAVVPMPGPATVTAGFVV